MIEEDLHKKLSRKPNVKLEHLKYPRHLMEWFTENNLSLAINHHCLAVIEVPECVHKKKIDRPIDTLIDQFDSYTEYVPRMNGIRIMGISFENSCHLENRCVIDSSPSKESHRLSIFRCCDRWTDISGIQLLDRPLRELDLWINELIANPLRFFSWRQ